jgi:hypothetical protein
MPLRETNLRASTLRFGGSIEDLNVLPTDMALLPEDIQSNCDDWIIVFKDE